jgi:arylsulfatase A-like enzyme/Flp pilus assembly protein TadD
MPGILVRLACIAGSALWLTAACGGEAERDRAESHLVAGDRLIREGRYEEAIAAFKEAAEVVPSDPRPLRKSAMALVFLRRDREALQRFERAAELQPDPSAEEFVVWATAFQRVGKLREAVEKYQGALDVDPTHLPAMNNLAVLLIEAEPARATRLLEEAVRLEPGDTQLVYNLGRAYQKQGRIEEAYNLIRRAVAMTSPAEASYQSRSEHLERLKEQLPRGAASREAPNVLLLVIDTLRADHLSSYGYHRKTTPRIDALASEGVLLENAISQASWTAPSMATLFTGLYPSVHGLNAGIDHKRLRTETREALPVPIQKALSPDRLTLAEVLRSHGYFTAGVVSNPYLDSRFGFAQGFDTYREPELAPASLLEPAETTNRSVFAWLDRERQEPFFLFVHYNDPHHPYEPPSPFDQKYVAGYEGTLIPSDTRSPESMVAKMVAKELTEEDKEYLLGIDPSETELKEAWAEKALEERLSEKDIEYLIGLYDGEIAYTDLQVGLLLEKVRSLQLDRDVLIVVTSDHGEEFFDHGWINHGRTLYDEQLRVPLIFHYPGALAAARIRAQVRIVDLMPTILELAEVPSIPDDLQGKSFVPLLRGEAKAKLGPAYSETTWEGKKKSLRTEAGLKLIQAEDAGPELFDLSEDPGEQKNLVEENPSRTQSLNRELELWVEANRQARARVHSESAILEEVVLDDRMKAQLEALGYVEPRKR